MLPKPLGRFSEWKNAKQWKRLCSAFWLVHNQKILVTVREAASYWLCESARSLVAFRNEHGTKRWIGLVISRHWSCAVVCAWFALVCLYAHELSSCFHSLTLTLLFAGDIYRLCLHLRMHLCFFFFFFCLFSCFCVPGLLWICTRVCVCIHLPD